MQRPTATATSVTSAATATSVTAVTPCTKHQTASAATITDPELQQLVAGTFSKPLSGDQERWVYATIPPVGTHRGYDIEAFKKFEFKTSRTVLVSDYGRVRMPHSTSNRRASYCLPSAGRHYAELNLRQNPEFKRVVKVHVLVAFTFLREQLAGMSENFSVDHILPLLKVDNRVSNLRFATASEQANNRRNSYA